MIYVKERLESKKFSIVYTFVKAVIFVPSELNGFRPSCYVRRIITYKIEIFYIVRESDTDIKQYYFV